MRIFLLGFMGSGKSTLAKKIAHKLSLKFIDLDEMIESKAGLKIIDIFTLKGEENFRDIEHECLKNTLFIDNIIVATGGGTPCFFDNMDIINNNGISVYIKLNPGILASRLLKAKTERPLLKDIKDKAELIQRIEELFTSREQYYLKSKIIVEGKNADAEGIIRIIKEAIKN